MESLKLEAEESKKTHLTTIELLSNKPLTAQQIADAAHGSLAEVDGVLAEMLEPGHAFDVDSSGTRSYALTE